MVAVFFCQSPNLYLIYSLIRPHMDIFEKIIENIAN